MRVIRLKLNIGGTFGSEAWAEIIPFEQILSSSFGGAEGGSGVCKHGVDVPHLPGEWSGAVVRLENDLLAQYAVAHYLRQPRVLDATVEEA